MKSALLTLLTLTLTASAAEIRVVNGVPVDITPALLYRANATTLTNRPMPHWKCIHVQTVAEHVASWDRCAIDVEGTPKEVWLGNIPAEIGAPIKRKNAIDARLAELQGSTPTGLAGDRTGRTAAAARAGYDQEMTALRGELKKLKPVAEAAPKIETWAMWTGKKFRDIEVWDCGVRKVTR